MPTFADVIVPVPLEPTFTYSIPDVMRGEICVGMRVVIPFGRNKFYTGIIESLHDNQPKGYEVKPIASLPDTKPIVGPSQIKLWRWIADYYLCSVGDVMRAALPAGLKIESETHVQVNPDMEPDEAAAVLTERELLAWQVLYTKGVMSLTAFAKEATISNVAQRVNRMMKKGAVVVSEKLSERFRPKKVKYVRLRIPRHDKEAMQEAFNNTKRSSSQQRVLQALVAMSGFMHPTAKLAEVTQEALLQKADALQPAIRDLDRKGLVEVYVKEVSRFRYNGTPAPELPPLSPAQHQALRDMGQAYKTSRVCLLHGVTGSGKTEIYMHIIRQVLESKMQVLFLVPEIALTSQLTSRLQKVFGDQVLIYHSRFSDNERIEVWQTLMHPDRPKVVIGARSAVFLPFEKLGLVIVDEEHEQSYKQFDPAPRYNARDVAMVLASMHGAKVVLGSATPSIETYYKALEGKFGLATLSDRFTGVPLPEINIVDTVKARKQKDMHGNLAGETIAAVNETLASDKQVILFQNRRGYAPSVRCAHCDFTPRCEHCDVSLSYHKRLDRLVCHYCGANYPVPKVCPKCGEADIEKVGYGTERIEDEASENFGDAKLVRMDLDTTRNKESYGKIIDQFSDHQADILVGTQMVTKGLDFDNVGTVVVADADATLNYPDFRSAERAFNMLEQVGGRAGRRDVPGKVYIQTRTPDHPVMRFLQTHDYKSFYEHEIAERQKYYYPPFSRVIYIYLRNRNVHQLEHATGAYAFELRRLFGNRVFGPEEPAVSRIQNMYIRKIMLKVEPQASVTRVKEILRQLYISMKQTSTMQGTIIHYDVDPQ